jgi:hypothetical protein
MSSAPIPADAKVRVAPPFSAAARQRACNASSVSEPIEVITTSIPRSSNRGT